MRPVLHLRGHVLPDGPRDLYVVDGRFARQPPAGRPVTTLVERGWLVPGLVDCHAHLSLHSPAGDDAPSVERVRASATAQRSAGVLLIREPGSPDSDSDGLRGERDMPRVQTAGRFLAPPGRYFPGLAREVAGADLATAVAEEAHEWVKLIGDFFEPGGRIEPNWSAAELRTAAEAAHRAGARITVHATHPQTIADAVAAGFDAIEHGTGLTEDLVPVLAQRGVALVPTLTISQGVRELTAAGLCREGAAEVSSWLDRAPRAVRAAADAGVTVLAGTDAGMGPHGAIAGEVGLLMDAGLAPEAALAAASWEARRYLAVPGIEENAPADLVVFADDPRIDRNALSNPILIVLDGVPIRA